MFILLICCYNIVFAAIVFHCVMYACSLVGGLSGIVGIMYSIIILIVMLVILIYINNFILFIIKMGHIRYIVFPSDGLRNVYKCFYSSGKIITIAIINRAVRDTIGKIKLDDKVSELISNRFNNLGCMYNIMKKIIVESLDNLDECCMALVYLDSSVSIKDVVYSVMKNAISTEFMFIKKVVQKRCIEYALAFIVNVLFISNIVGALNSGKPFSHYMGAFVIFICLKIFIMSVAKSYLMEITIKGYLKERRLYSAEELSNK